MNRLTKDLNTPHDDTEYSDAIKDAPDREQIVLTKLKHLEDVEDQFGIPLTLLKYGSKVMIKDAMTQRLLECEISSIDLMNKEFSAVCETGRYSKVPFARMGITWFAE